MGALLSFALSPHGKLLMAALAGAALLTGVYAYAHHAGRQAAAVDALETSVKTLRQRNQIDDEVSASDASALCRDFGLPDDQIAECVRRVRAPHAEP